MHSLNTGFRIRFLWHDKSKRDAEIPLQTKPWHTVPTPLHSTCLPRLPPPSHSSRFTSLPCLNPAPPTGTLTFSVILLCLCLANSCTIICKPCLPLSPPTAQLMGTYSLLHSASKDRVVYIELRGHYTKIDCIACSDQLQWVTTFYKELHTI